MNAPKTTLPTPSSPEGAGSHRVSSVLGPQRGLPAPALTATPPRSPSASAGLLKALGATLLLAMGTHARAQPGPVTLDDLRERGPAMLYGSEEAVKEVLRYGSERTTPAADRTALLRALVLLRPEQAPVLMSRLAALGDRRTRRTCARLGGLLTDDASLRTLSELVQDRDPAVSAAARASLALRGDEASLAEVSAAPTSPSADTAAWQLLARAAGGDEAARSAVGPMLETAVGDAETMVLAWRLHGRGALDALLPCLYLRLSFQPLAALDRYALLRALEGAPGAEVGPLLRCLARSSPSSPHAEMRELLATRSPDQATHLLQVQDSLDTAHGAARERRVPDAVTALKAAWNTAAENGLSDWGLPLEARVLRAVAPALTPADPDTPRDDAAPWPEVRAMVAADRVPEAQLVVEGLRLTGPVHLSKLSLLTVSLKVPASAPPLAGGLRAFGLTFILEGYDAAGVALSRTTVGVPSVSVKPGGAATIPVTVTEDVRGTASLRATLRDREGRTLGSATMSVTPNPRAAESGWPFLAAIRQALDAAAGPRSLTAYGRPPASPDGFRFLVAGHLYGDPSGDHPAATLRRAAPRLRQQNPAFLMTCGDIFWSTEDPSVDDTVGLFNELAIPVFNAPGNHDVKNRPLYLRRFGAAHGFFIHGRSLFVILDTEHDPWNISGSQLEELREITEWVCKSDRIDHVFLFAHKLLFVAKGTLFPVLAPHMNAQDGFTGSINFIKDVEPLLTRMAKDRAVYWFSGDIGIAHSETLFHHRDPVSGVTFIATGIGDLPRDLILQVDVGENGAVRIQPVALNPETAVRPVEAYGVSHWRETFR